MARDLLFGRLERNILGPTLPLSIRQTYGTRPSQTISLHPRKQLLVASPLDWPGVSSAAALYRGETTIQRAFYVDAVREIEEKTARMHRKNGTTPMGARTIGCQKPHDKPKAFKASPAPIFHAANREDFWAMHNARKGTVAHYRVAAKRLKRGETDVSFPEGCFPPRLPFVKAPAPT